MMSSWLSLIGRRNKVRQRRYVLNPFKDRDVNWLHLPVQV